MSELIFRSKRGLVVFFSLLSLCEIYLLIVEGLEFYNIFVISIIAIYGFLLMIEPFYSIYLVVFISFFLEGKSVEGFVLFNLFGFNWYLMDVVLLITFLIVSYRYISGEYKIEKNIIVVWIFLFFIACAFSIFWGIKNGHSKQDVFYDLRGFFYYIIFIPALFLLNSYKRIRLLLLFIIITGTLKCIVDSFMSLYILPTTFDDTTMKYLPFARLEGYNEIVYPLTFVSSFFYLFFSKRFIIRLLLFTSLFFSLLATFLSYTRGSWLAAFLTIIIGMVLLIRTKKLRVKTSVIISFVFLSVSAIVVLGLLGIFPLQFLTARATSVSLHKIDISNLGRLVEYSTALSAFLNQPIFGAGLGFKFTYFAPGIGAKSTIYCHNSYLYVLSKMGIVGFIPFLLIFLYSLRVGYNVLKSNLENKEIGVVFSFTIMLLAIVIKSFTTWHLNTITFSLFIGILLGVLITYDNKLKKIVGN